MAERVVIVSAVRTAIGKMGGQFASVPAVDLGATVNALVLSPKKLMKLSLAVLSRLVLARM